VTELSPAIAPFWRALEAHRPQISFHKANSRDTQAIRKNLLVYAPAAILQIRNDGGGLMAVWRSMTAMTLMVLNSLWVVTAASADQQLTDIKQTVNEIIGSCALRGSPADYLKESLSSGLEDFLRQSIKAKSADLAKLNDMLGQLPTGTEEILRDLKSEKGVQTFFSIYFECIRHQASLKLKSWNIDLK
jgi:hypothetical protein